MSIPHNQIYFHKLLQILNYVKTKLLYNKKKIKNKLVEQNYIPFFLFLWSCRGIAIEEDQIRVISKVEKRI